MAHGSNDPKIETDRRTFIKGVGITGTALGGITSPALAKPDKASGADTGESVSLIDGPAEFQLFWSEVAEDSNDPDELGDFGYPSTPSGTSGAFLAGEDPVGGLFDGSEIEKTPNGGSLHHTLQFFQGYLMRKNRGKPYVLNHEGNGRYTSRGQHVNFEARTQEELKGIFRQVGLNPRLVDVPPLSILAGKKWRGVGSEVIQLLGDPKESRRAAWTATRVDFYNRSHGRPEYRLSVLYIIYPNLDEDGNPVPANPSNPDIQPILPSAHAEGKRLIEEGRLNLGGQ